ncbi:MBL fold metallo-hydrolase [Candidatus Dojkabacteria bacterium]|nr:MBL fold metallo-hydrolase [Candidatus Dojkabacteria bacterium]
MKIKYNGYTSFTFTIDNLVALTDPGVAKENGVKGIPTEADVVINTSEGSKYEVRPLNRSSVFEINSPGEYEISEFMIQRPIGTPFYIMDHSLIRVVYIGLGSKNINIKDLRDLGDVDVLLLPYSNGEGFPSYDLLQEIISKVEPVTLVPYGTDTDGTKSKEEFIKYFGFTNATNEKVLKIDSKPESEDRSMKIIFLD